MSKINILFLSFNEIRSYLLLTVEKVLIVEENKQ